MPKEQFRIENFDFDENVDDSAKIELEELEQNLNMPQDDNSKSKKFNFNNNRIDNKNNDNPKIAEHNKIEIDKLNLIEDEDNNLFTNTSQNDKIIDNNEEDYFNKENLMNDDNLFEYNDVADKFKDNQINVKNFDFPEISTQYNGSKFKTDIFANIPVTIDVFLGNTTISLKEIHEFSQGTVIELDKFYGEPVELKINGELIATGEVVAIDNKYGIMIKDIVKS
jgi:flagellar motor switch protein FliN